MCDLVKKILIVDDEEDIALVVKAVLENAGFKVETVNSGKDAIKLLKKSPDFDLIIIDFFMPGMSGKQLLKKIKKDDKMKKFKCIFLTVAQFSKKGMDDLIKLGSLDYIKKPFENEDLVKRVKKIVG